MEARTAEMEVILTMAPPPCSRIKGTAALVQRNGHYYAPHLPLQVAFLESITAFHGRVFSGLFAPNTPQIWVTAFEAIAGLVIEGVFIAMLTQRFFGK